MSYMCPKCGSTNVDVPTVDIGVGEQQCAPATCMDCNWQEPYPEPDFDAEQGAEELRDTADLVVSTKKTEDGK